MRGPCRPAQDSRQNNRYHDFDNPTAGSNHESLSIRGLSKYFAGLHALDGVSFDLQRGEILGLIGPNGSGKTTLINVVTGLLPATSGQVFVDGAEITNKKPFQVAHAGLAGTFQTIRLFRELTVSKMLKWRPSASGLSRRDARQGALEVLEEHRHRRLDRDAGGAVPPYGLERRVELRPGAGDKPKFLFLHEPAAGLNEEESEESSMLEAHPAEKNLGMLIVDHDMRLIMRLCHRLHVLNFGRTIGEGTPEEVRKIPAVLQAYLGKAAVGGRPCWN